MINFFKHAAWLRKRERESDAYATANDLEQKRIIEVQRLMIERLRKERDELFKLL